MIFSFGIFFFCIKAKEKYNRYLRSNGIIPYTDFMKSLFVLQLLVIVVCSFNLVR